jgi:hypothetical protein
MNNTMKMKKTWIMVPVFMLLNTIPLFSQIRSSIPVKYIKIDSNIIFKDSFIRSDSLRIKSVDSNGREINTPVSKFYRIEFLDYSFIYDTITPWEVPTNTAECYMYLSMEEIEVKSTRWLFFHKRRRLMIARAHNACNAGAWNIYIEKGEVGRL